MIKKNMKKKANGSYHAEPLMTVLPRTGTRLETEFDVHAGRGIDRDV